jgi:surface protein
MQGMFNDAWAFNKGISAWDVSSVTNMYKMFKNATSSNEDISA